VRCIAIGAGAGACAGSVVGSAEAIHVLLASLPGEYQAVGAAWSLYGLVGGLVGALVGVLLLPARRARPETLWCVAFLLVATPLAGMLTFATVERRVFDGAGVPLAWVGVGGSGLAVLAATGLWLGLNVMTKTPLRILATARGTAAAWTGGLTLAWIFALSPAPMPTVRLPPSAAPAAGPPDMVLIVVDALGANAFLPGGRTGGSTPNLEALVAEGVSFEQAIAASTSMRSAMASLFTSLAGSSHGCVRPGDPLAPEFLTVAEAVADRGYRTVGFPNHTNIAATRGFGQGFEHYAFASRFPFFARESTAELLAYQLAWKLASRLDPRFNVTVNAPAEELVAAAGAELAAVDRPPLFVFLHLLEPAAAAGATGGEDPGLAAAGDGAAALLAAVQRVDRALGTLFDGLRASGRFNDTLIVVTSEHGFVPTGPGAEVRQLHEAGVRVPLIVKLPGGEWAGARVPWQVRTIDIAPTLLDAAGGRPGPPWQGLELFPDSFEADLALLHPPLDEDLQPPAVWAPPDWGSHPASRDALVESWSAGVAQRALRRGGAKVILTVAAPADSGILVPNIEYYDLRTDPEEQQDRSDEQSSQQAAMRAALESIAADRERAGVRRPDGRATAGGDLCTRCAMGEVPSEECVDCLSAAPTP
jgi:arylsulfatase A-like enzyme